MNDRISKDSGFGLLELMISAAIGIVVAGSFSRMLTHSMEASSHISQGTDLETIRQLIVANIDSAATLSAGGIKEPSDIAAGCKSTSDENGQAAPFLRLMRRAPDGTPIPVTEALVTAAGNAKGSGKIGDWSIRTTCSDVEKTFVIRVARITKAGDFAEDRLIKGQIYDFYNNPHSLMIGKDFPISLNAGGHYPGKLSKSTHVVWDESGTASDDINGLRIREKTIDVTIKMEVPGKLFIRTGNGAQLAGKKVGGINVGLAKDAVVSVRSQIGLDSSNPCDDTEMSHSYFEGDKNAYAWVTSECVLELEAGSYPIHLYAITTAGWDATAPQFGNTSGYTYYTQDR